MRVTVNKPQEAWKLTVDVEKVVFWMGGNALYFGREGAGVLLFGNEYAEVRVGGAYSPTLEITEERRP